MKPKDGDTMLSMSWMETRPHQHCPPSPLGIFTNVPTAHPANPLRGGYQRRWKGLRHSMENMTFFLLVISFKGNQNRGKCILLFFSTFFHAETFRLGPTSAPTTPSCLLLSAMDSELDAQRPTDFVQIFSS